MKKQLKEKRKTLFPWKCEILAARQRSLNNHFGA